MPYPFNLTIKHGTTILFDPVPDPNKEITGVDVGDYYGGDPQGYHNVGKYEFFVDGNLYASGTPQRPIAFRNAEEPYYPINLYTQVIGNAVLKYFETGGIDRLTGTIVTYGDVTIYSSTFHGPGGAGGRGTLCSNTVEWGGGG